MSVSGSIDLPKGDANVKNGISVWTAGIFLVAEMAGAGFLALPSAVASTGWIGIPLMFIFCFSLAFAGERLGQCWIILEERWPEYRESTRQPYMEIAHRSYGEVGRKIILFSVIVTLIGTSIVYIILIAQFLHAFFEDFSICFFTTVISLALIPFTWLGTPKDFWQAPIIAMISTIVACFVIFIQLLLDRDTGYIPEKPFYRHATFTSFSMGFGTIMAAFGGGPVFPTIQNDMKVKTQFSKSITMAFIALLVLYFPVTFTGYLLMGYEVPSNILLYRESNLTLSIKIAVGFEVINLFGSFLILVNPVFQVLEETLNIPSSFSIKRILLRTCIVLLDLVIALGIPDFSLILNLIGGSTMTICSLIAPAAMFMKLVDDKSNPSWSERSIPTWLRVLLYEIIFVGIFGGICSTGSAIYAIINSDFGSSCFAHYTQT